MFLSAGRAEELPGVVYKEFPTADESSPEVHALVKKAADLVYPQPREARPLLVDALQAVDKGARIDEYDYLWVHYGLLKSSFEPGASTFGAGTEEDYVKVARKVLGYLEKEGVGDWVFTPFGALKLEVYREAGNGLAWYLYDDPKADREKLGEALEVIERTEEHIKGREHYFILDTKVRILLKLGRRDEAFKIVRNVLGEVPDFGDFADLRDNQEYLSWQESWLQSKDGECVRKWETWRQRILTDELIRADPRWTVVPGESVGPLKLGMTAEAVVQAIGPSPPESFGEWEYPMLGLSLGVRGGRVVSITAGGSSCGDPEHLLFMVFREILGGDFPARVGFGVPRQKVGMGSRRMDVVALLGKPLGSSSDRQEAIAVLGEPCSLFKDESYEFMRYPNMDLIFRDRYLSWLKISLPVE